MAVKITKNLILSVILISGCAPFPDLPEDAFGQTSADDSEIAESETQSSGSSGNSSSESLPDNLDTSIDVGEGGTDTGEDNVETLQPIDPSGLVLNEIYYDAPGGDTDGVLFVELFAVSAGSLGSYTIRFVNGDDGKVTETIELPEYAEMGDESFYVIAVDNFDPQNGPDGVQLLDREGQLVDSVVYGQGALSISDDGVAIGEGSAAEDSMGGYSISRYPVGFDNDDNAIDFVINSLPSPGSEEVIEPEI
jgi:hypothetical protein